MSSDANTNRPFLSLVLLGIVDFCCILIGLEHLSGGKIKTGAMWIVFGLGSGSIGYYWPQIKSKVGRKPLPQSELELGSPVVVDTTTNIVGLNRRFIQIPASTRTRRECRGQLLSVWKWVNEDWQPTQVDEPLDLNWSIIDAPITFLEPNVNRRLNVFFLQSDGRNINFASDRVPYRMALSSAPSDVFKLHVRIADGEGCSKEVSFKATFGQNWNDIAVEEV